MPRNTNPITPARLAIGAVLRELREAKGWTVADVARAIAVTWTAVKNWEAGRRSPQIWDLPTIAEAFGISELTLSKKIFEKINHCA